MRSHSMPEIELPPGSIAIADLHLDLGASASVEPFARWVDALSSSSRATPRLLILGDLFDVWVGPAQERMPGAPRVIEALRRLFARGTAVAIVPGNRDFLLDRSFEARTGARLFGEGFVGRAAGRRILCLHGDTLCTKDLGYQRLRRVLRSRTVSWLAPRLPLAIGTRVATRLRRASVKAVAAKLPEEKSIQAAAVRAAAIEARAEVVVCGHAHAFRDEQLTDPAGTSGGSSLRWIVLDAFGGERDLLEVGPAGALQVRGSDH